MKKNVVLFFIFTLNLVFVSCSDDDSENVQSKYFCKSYGSESNDCGYSLLETDKGEFVITGEKGGDLWILKTDSLGNVIFDKNFGDIDGGEVGKSIIGSANDGFIIYGHDNAHAYGAQLILKIDSNGREEWHKTYWSEVYYFVWSWSECAFNKTLDNGYIIVGIAVNNSIPENDIMVIKTDSLGKEEWRHSYGEENWDEKGWSISNANDGGYIIAGQRYLGEGTDTWVIKIDSVGNIEWEKTYEPNTPSTKLIKHSDSSYLLLIGWNLLEIDNYGEIISSKMLDFGGTSIEKTLPEGFVIVGEIYVDDSYRRVITVKLNNYLDEEWREIYAIDQGLL